MSNAPKATPAAGRVILATTLSHTWDSVVLGVMIGFIYSSIGPETGEPSGWRFGLMTAGCCVVGGGLAGLSIGIWRVCRRAPEAANRAEPDAPEDRPRE
jgi:hypothetical protein